MRTTTNRKASLAISVFLMAMGCMSASGQNPPSNPNPPDGAEFEALFVGLGWSPAAGAVSYDVFFGTDYDEVATSSHGEGAYLLNTVDPRAETGPFLVKGTFYWRVDARMDGTVTPGPVWSFTVKPRIVYVDADASGANDGTSWDNAYSLLQDALKEDPFDEEFEIRVAQGTYYPDLGGGQTVGDRNAHFQLYPGMKLYGGYAGSGAADPNARNVSGYPTILSGFLGPELRSYHVVEGCSGGHLDGFTITGGNADDDVDERLGSGAGMYNDDCDYQVVRNCTFTQNSAKQRGGGMCNYDCDYQIVDNCTFSENNAVDGGGLLNWSGELTVTNCTFSENNALSGGGLLNWSGELTVTNCTFSGNNASYYGGGVFNGSFELTVPNRSTVANCTFSENNASSLGAGLFNEVIELTVTNCTFSGNDAGWGGGLASSIAELGVTNCTFSGNTGATGGGLRCMAGASTVMNSIFWGNAEDQIAYDEWAVPTVAFCCIQGGFPGAAHSIDADPMFENGLRLSAGLGSPCIDAGYSPACSGDIDLDGNPRFVDHPARENTGVGTPPVDMGAYECQWLDADQDGIEDVIDGDPYDFSDAFADAATPETRGQIVDRGGEGQTVIVTDVPGVGIRVNAIGSGYDSAEVRFCGGRFQILLSPGDDFVMRGCTSEIEVFRGTIVITYFGNDGTVAYITLPEHNRLEFGADTFSITAPADNTDPVIVEVNGKVFTLTPGADPSPVVEAIAGPLEPVPVSAAINVSADFWDPDELGTHVATWDWGDGVKTPGTVALGTATGSHTYSVPGVYAVTLTVTDKDGLSGQSVFEYAVVYDPVSGFVTGGGWINSPLRAYVPNPALAGKASFGFVSKYLKGATVPTGNTEFRFESAGLDFHSTSYEWLLVNQNGTNAQYKGSGTINGTGDYKFMLWAGDGDPDTFRIRIWSEGENGTEVVVYDNGVSQPIGGGSIVVHRK